MSSGNEDLEDLVVLDGEKEGACEVAMSCFMVKFDFLRSFVAVTET